MGSPCLTEERIGKDGEGPPAVETELEAPVSVEQKLIKKLCIMSPASKFWLGVCLQSQLPYQDMSRK